MKQRKAIDRRPKCKNPDCKDRFVPFNNSANQKYCMKKDDCIRMQTELAVKQREKANSEEEKKRRAIENVRTQQTRIVVYSKKYKSELAVSCQKLARMIDYRFNFTCVDCGRAYGSQADGGHFNSKGSNITLFANLHNIHTQASNCNRNGMGGGRRLEYYRGLVARYGKWYADYVDTGLQKEYPLIKLSEQEIFDKLTIARRLIRTFDTFQFTDAIAAREQINQILGIYRKSVYSYRETNPNEQ